MVLETHDKQLGKGLGLVEKSCERHPQSRHSRGVFANIQDPAPTHCEHTSARLEAL